MLTHTHTYAHTAGRAHTRTQAGRSDAACVLPEAGSRIQSRQTRDTVPRAPITLLTHILSVFAMRDTVEPSQPSSSSTGANAVLSITASLARPEGTIARLNTSSVPSSLGSTPAPPQASGGEPAAGMVTRERRLGGGTGDPSSALDTSGVAPEYSLMSSAVEGAHGHKRQCGGTVGQQVSNFWNEMQESPRAPRSSRAIPAETGTHSYGKESSEGRGRKQAQRGPCGC